MADASSAAVRAPEAPERHTPSRFEIVRDWSDLRARSHGIYLGAVRVVQAPGQHSILCASGLRETAESNTPAPAAELCTDEGLVPTRQSTMGSGPIAAAAVWVVTEVHDGREQISALAPVVAPCTDAGCGEPPRNWIAETYRCGQLDMLYSRVPPADQACEQDTECALLPPEAAELTDFAGTPCDYFRRALSLW